MVTYIFNSEVLWLIPCIFSVAFMLWVLWSFLKEERRRG
jgi:hypothetical protein